MAAADQTAQILLTGDAKDLIKAFSDANSQIQSSLKNINDGIGKAADSAKESGDKMGEAFSELGAKAAELLTVAAAIEFLKTAIDSTMEYAESIEKLSDAMGTSTEKAEAWNLAAKEQGVNTQTLQGMFDSLREKVQRNEKELDTLGISTKDSSGHMKDMSTIMAEAQTYIQGLGTKADQAAAMQYLFRDAGTDVQKVLALNNTELDKATGFLQSLGMNTEQALEESDKFTAAQADLTTALDAVYQKIGIVLLPILTELATWVAEKVPLIIQWFQSISSTVGTVFATVWDTIQNVLNALWTLLGNIFKGTGADAIDWGTAITTVFQTIRMFVLEVVAVFNELVNMLKLVAAQMIEFGNASVNAINSIGHGDFKGVGQSYSNMIDGMKANNADFLKDENNLKVQLGKDLSVPLNTAQGQAIKNYFDGLGKSSESGPPNKITPTAGGGAFNNPRGAQQNADSMLQAQAALQKAIAASNLAIYKEGLTEQKDALDRALSDNIISYESYYAQQQNLNHLNTEASIQAKQQEIAAQQTIEQSSSKPADKVKAQAQIVTIQGQINILKMQEVEFDKQSNDQLQQKLKAYQTMKIGLQGSLETLLGGKNADQVMAEFEDKYKDTKKRLEAENDSEGLGLLSNLLNATKAEADINDIEVKYKAMSTQMAIDKANADAASKASGDTQYEQQLRTNALNATYIDQLTQILQQELAIAQATGVGGQQRQLDLQQRIAELKAEAQQTNQFLSSLKQGLESSFGTFFQSLMNGTSSVKDAFKSLFDSITQQINQIVSQQLAQKLVSSLGISAGGSGVSVAGGGTSTGGIFGWFASLLGGFRASGGPVDGSTPYVVGEKGPEIFVPKTSGSIVSNEQSQRLTKGGTTVNIYTNDANSFRKTQNQTYAELNKQVTRAGNRNN